MEPDAHSDLAGAFKDAMRRFASGVTVVTARTNGQMAGMTATAVTSLSMDPPALLICINRNAQFHAHLTVGTRFCVNILNADQAALSMVFGGSVPAEERFSHGVWRMNRDDPPVLADAQANVMGIVDSMTAYGTHTIFVGRVEWVQLHGDVRPLVYYDGQYLRSAVIGANYRAASEASVSP